MRLTDDDPNDFTDDQIWQRLSRWITPTDATLERGAVYTFRSRIAETWHSGAVFLAGDAAHQMPPFMGQGLCAGIRDAANLWWKLVAVLNGHDSTLLETYQSEREANARQFIEMSVALGQLVNQTSADTLPKGKLASIWPNLGPGLGPRDDIGGTLTPQTTDNQILSDDMALNAFHLLTKHGQHELLDCQTHQPSPNDTIIRPDGYALGPATPELLQQARELNASLARSPRLG